MALRQDDEIHRWGGALTALMLALGWLAGALATFRLAEPYEKWAWLALKATPQHPRMWIAAAAGLLLGALLWRLLWTRYATGFTGAAYQHHVRGRKILNAHALAAQTAKSAVPDSLKGLPRVKLAGVPLPYDLEPMHVLVGGGTGAGKSVAIGDLLYGIFQRGDRRIVVDPNGGYLRHFYQPGDVVLNPFDARGEGWSIFNEIARDFDCDRFALSLIPRSPSTEQEEWNAMARGMVTETLRKLWRSGTTQQFYFWMASASNSDLAKFLADTTAAGLFHEAERTLGSVRAVLSHHIGPHKYLRPGTFSVGRWLAEGWGNLWITWREDMLQALRPLISTWVDVLAASILSMSEDYERRLWLICDELDSLEKLSYVIDAATKGRKHGLRIVGGIQSLAQLNKTYGREEAMVLRACFRSLLLLGVAGDDTYTAEEFSKSLGDHEVRRESEHEQYPSSMERTRGSRGLQTVRERLVMPTEFAQLPNLQGYLSLANDYPVARVRLAREDYHDVAEPYIARADTPLVLTPATYDPPVARAHA